MSADPQPIADHRSRARARLAQLVGGEQLADHARARPTIVAQQSPHQLHRRVDRSLDLDRYSPPETDSRRPASRTAIRQHALGRLTVGHDAQRSPPTCGLQLPARPLSAPPLSATTSPSNSKTPSCARRPATGLRGPDRRRRGCRAGRAVRRARDHQALHAAVRGRSPRRGRDLRSTTDPSGSPSRTRAAVSRSPLLAARLVLRAGDRALELAAGRKPRRAASRDIDRLADAIVAMALGCDGGATPLATNATAQPEAVACVRVCVCEPCQASGTRARSGGAARARLASSRLAGASNRDCSP